MCQTSEISDLTWPNYLSTNHWKISRSLNYVSWNLKNMFKIRAKRKKILVTIGTYASLTWPKKWFTQSLLI